MSGQFSQSRFRHLELKEESTPMGTVLWITLSRPKAHNSLSMELTAELHELLTALQHPLSLHESVEQTFPRVVVLGGAGGRAFSSGR